MLAFASPPQRQSRLPLLRVETKSIRFRQKSKQKQQKKNEKSNELSKRLADQEASKAELKETQGRCAKDKDSYDSTVAEFSKAMASLQKAIQALSAAKPNLLEVRKSIATSIALADALSLIEKNKSSAVAAFLQQNSTADPAGADYEYHSQGIIDTLSKLLKTFEAQRKQEDAEYVKKTGTCFDTEKGLNSVISENTAALDDLKASSDSVDAAVASLRESLINAQKMVKDDQLYLKDLTKQCEDRAAEWDQRTELRGGELQALAQALELLNGDVSEPANISGQPVLFLVRKMNVSSLSSPSFLQSSIVHAHTAGAVQLLSGGHLLLSPVRAEHHLAAAMLRKEGKRLKSPVLASLATHIDKDPFDKVKQLIQQVIEILSRLAAGGTKSAFCEAELDKASKEPEARLAEAKKLNMEIASLEATQGQLKAGLELLNGPLDKLTKDLELARKNREQDKANNLKTMQEARKGLDAITEAIEILKVFYKQAAEATALFQASPNDAMQGPEFGGPYSGKQEGAKGIIHLLEIIQTDFDRIIQMTTVAEKKAVDDFVEFEKATELNLKGKKKQASCG